MRQAAEDGAENGGGGDVADADVAAPDVTEPDAGELVASLRSLIEGARSMPMSGSALVNRALVLDLVSSLERVVTNGRTGRDGAVADHDGVIAAARGEADRIVAEARLERERLVSDSEVLRVARELAGREREVASTEAEELRQETDDYVDTRLATFEMALTRTLQAVARGRARLQGRSHFAALGEPDEEGADGGLTTPDELKPDEGRQPG
ncbi:MAG: hypothetical protein QOI06_1864 [Nocardioidaceae bacterium]|jgi:vacuolar-type H+-ATPase subunit H|nr:hypothetical protein [Nocardioidaceae bacterium]